MSVDTGRLNLPGQATFRKRVGGDTSLGIRASGLRARYQSHVRHLHGGISVRRTVLATAFAAIASVCMVIPASAATGPFYIKTQNHAPGKNPVCIKVSPDQPGENVVQGDFNSRDCRKMFFNRVGFINGHPYGEIQTSADLDLASPNCSTVTLEPSGGTGTIWVQYVADIAKQYIISRHCNSVFGGGTNCVAALSASGVVGSNWIVTRLGTRGWLQRVVWIQTSSKSARSQRAGC